MALFKKKPLMSDYRMPDDAYPRCPHCEKPVDGLMSRELIADLG